MSALQRRNFFDNAREYFRPVLSPLNGYPAHAGIVIALGLVGCVLWLRVAPPRHGARPTGRIPRLRFAAFVAGWMLLQVIVVFSYVWGRAQAPSAARLVIAIDTFFSFFAAWALTRVAQAMAALRRGAGRAPRSWRSTCPSPAQHRMLNRLTQTRETATAWRFFESLHEKRILIVTDRPDLFTIMEYGAMSFEAARQDPFLLRRLRAAPLLRHLRRATDQAVDEQPAARIRHLADAKARDDAGVSERRGRVDPHLATRTVKREIRYLP